MSATAVSSLVQSLVHPDRETRARAAHDLRYDVGPFGLKALGPKDVSYLVAALNDPEEEIRVVAAWACGCIGAAAAPAVPRLVERWPQATQRERRQLLDTFCWLGTEAAEAMPTLLGVKLVPQTRDFFKKLGRRAVPGLAEKLHSAEPREQRELLTLLGRMGPAASEAGPALLRLLASSSTRDGSLIQAIAKIGLGGVERFDDLIQFVDDENIEVRTAVVLAIAHRVTTPDRPVPESTSPSGTSTGPATGDLTFARSAMAHFASELSSERASERFHAATSIVAIRRGFPTLQDVSSDWPLNLDEIVASSRQEIEAATSDLNDSAAEDAALRARASTLGVSFERPLSLEELSQLERVLGHRLPSDLRGFLRGVGRGARGAAGLRYGFASIEPRRLLACHDLGSRVLVPLLSLGCGMYESIELVGPSPGSVWHDNLEESHVIGPNEQLLPMAPIAPSFTSWYQSRLR